MPHMNHEPPKDYCCPITTEIMTDPVMAADGHSYERSAIINWLANNNTSPLTREELEHKQVIANRTLKKAIQTFVDENKSVYQMKFIEAMQEGDYDTIWHLEKLGIDLKTTDEKDWSLIHYAANRGDLTEIRDLSQKGLLHNNKTARVEIEFYLPKLVNKIQEAEATITSLQKKNCLLSSDIYYYYGDKDKRPIGNEAALKNEMESLNKSLEPLRRQTQSYPWSGNDYSNPSMSDKWRLNELEIKIKSLESRLNSAQSDYNNLVFARKSAETELLNIREQIGKLTVLIKAKKQQLAKTYVNLTPLHLAINNHALPTVQFFLDQGFSVEDKDINGATLIFWSIYKNDVELFNLLIENGANLEAIDNEGNTLLHVAAQYADKPLVEYLLSQGFNYRIKNNAGQTPADLAARHDRTEIADYIAQQGEQLWQNMPKRLVAQDQRISMLEQQIKLLQEQLATLLNHGPQKASNDAPAISGQPPSTVSRLGLFHHQQNHFLNKVTKDMTSSSTHDNDSTSRLDKFN